MDVKKKDGRKANGWVDQNTYYTLIYILRISVDAPLKCGIEVG